MLFFRLRSVQLDKSHDAESSILLNVVDVAVAAGECSTESCILLNVEDVAVAPRECSTESSILLNVEDVAVAPGECLLHRVAFSSMSRM